MVDLPVVLACFFAVLSRNISTVLSPEAYRMPLPADVDEFKVPDFEESWHKSQPAIIARY